MRIRTLWKSWDDDAVELLFALDDNTCAENWEAWEDGRNAAIERYGIMPEDTREVMIHVPYAKIAALFEVPEVDGEIDGPA